MKDIALENNLLPPEIKNNLITLGAWSMRYSTLAILQDLPIQPLIDVNRNVADGVAQQMPAPVAAMPIVSSASTAA